MRKSVVLWILSVAAAAAMSAGVTAQFQSGAQPRILSGSDVGFRIEGRDMSGNPAGTLVIRVDGEWVPASSMPTVRRASQ
jgi:hypothetical protein